MSREAPAPFCEGLGVQFPRPTHHRHHYVRDVTLREDASRIRRNPGIFARLRSFTLNILRKNQVTNVSEALFDNALSLDNLRAYVGVF